MAVISGTVKDVNGDFARRVVRAYRRSDGAFAAQAVSDATTGAFSCTALDASAHYVLQLDGEVAEYYDPYWSNVVLAMHMDDVGLTDLKGHAVTLAGNAARSAIQSKFGGYSAAFDGAGDLASVASSSDFAFGTGDFTIEFFVRQAVAGAAVLLDCRPNSSSNGAYITLYVDASGVYLYVSSANRITGPAVSAGAWHHIALSRSSGSTRLFVDGTQAGATYADATSYISCPVNIGTSGDFVWVLNGHIDDLRITKGVARYTANFTPPAAAFLHGLSIGAPTTNALIFDNITPV